MRYCGQAFLRQWSSLAASPGGELIVLQQTQPFNLCTTVSCLSCCPIRKSLCCREATTNDMSAERHADLHDFAPRACRKGQLYCPTSL